MIFLKNKIPNWTKNKPLTPNGLFDHVLLCNLSRRPDKLKWAINQCKKVDINFEKIEAIDGQDEKWRNKLLFSCSNYGVAALNETMRIALKRAIDEKWESFLWMEDDVAFTKSFSIFFQIGVKKIPDTWEIIHGGVDYMKAKGEINIFDTYIGNNIVSKMSQHTFLTHFIAFKNTIFQKYYNVLLENPEKPIDSMESIEIYRNGYIFVPPIVLQEKKEIIPDLQP